MYVCSQRYMHQSTHNNLDIQYSYLNILCIYSICLQCLQIKNKKRNKPFCMCTCMYCIYLHMDACEHAPQKVNVCTLQNNVLHIIPIYIFILYCMYGKYFIVTAIEPPCFYSHSIWTKQSHSKEKLLLLKNECLLPTKAETRKSQSWLMYCLSYSMCEKSLTSWGRKFLICSAGNS